MASIKREIKHTLGLEGGKKAVDGLLDKLKAEYGSIFSDIKWNADHTAADISGKGFKGNFCVTEDCMKLNIELGLLVSAFKGKIEQEIDNQIKDIKSYRWLARQMPASHIFKAPDGFCRLALFL